MKLARELGYTLSELTARMSFDELLLWGAYLVLEAEETEKQQRRRR